MSKVRVFFNGDQDAIEIEAGTTLGEVAKERGKEARKAVAAKVNGEVVDFFHKVNGDEHVEWLTPEEPDSLEVLRHSTSHVMAAAVKELFPDVKVAIGPAIDTGFYYDFERDKPFVPEELAEIEKVMKRIIEQDDKFVRDEMKREDAIKFFEERGEKFKVEIIKDLEDPSVSIYHTGKFIDLCTGPHVPSTRRIPAFKLLNVAGSYWRGDEHREQLQRIYGTAFFDKKDLEAHLKNLEEALKRDHRRLGKELDLFSIEELGGPGLVYWHPKGALVRRLIEDFWRDEHQRRNYELVFTPHIARSELFKCSGHLGFYKDNMFGAVKVDNDEYILKPMNCPLHIQIYNDKLRSYRDLPLRLAELGTVYRYERSGVLHGMLRVRGFTQDDAHIFTTPEHLENEIREATEFAFFMLRTFGFHQYRVTLSTGPSAKDPEEAWKDFTGERSDWKIAEDTLAKVLDGLNIPYEVDPKGAAFYGPKIDIQVKDALGRLWQGPTVQFDFNLPKRLDVNYIASDGAKHPVYMVHRAMLGSIERFVGCLIEHYAGAFPLWLAPEQVRILAITDKHHEYAHETAAKLKAKGFRVDVDARNEKLGFKLREAKLAKLPYVAVAGDREVEEGTLSINGRGGADHGSMSLDAFVTRLSEEVASKA